MILIIGAGISGLTAGRELTLPFKILEKGNTIGGLAGQYPAGPHHFDYGGHYFHFQKKRRIRRYLNRCHPLVRFTRQSRVFLGETLIPFPIQYHLAFLPHHLKETVYRELSHATPPSFENLAAHLRSRFGPALFAHFFQPFLFKYYQTDLTTLDAGFGGESIPPPDRRKIRGGYRGKIFQKTGYNRFFHYPYGELRAFVDAYSRPIRSRIHTGQEVLRIDLHRREVFTASGSHSYSALLNTAPLSWLLSSIVQDNFSRLAPKLRSVSTQVVNFVLSRRYQNFHWVYLPSPDIPFYRAGYYPSSGPVKGYLERTLAPGSSSKPDDPDMSAAVGTLQKVGMIREKAEIRFMDSRVIPVSYVLRDHQWQPTVPAVLRQLKEHRVYSIGRYGSWRYSSMTDDIDQARKTARELNRHGP